MVLAGLLVLGLTIFILFIEFEEVLISIDQQFTKNIGDEDRED